MVESFVENNSNAKAFASLGQLKYLSCIAHMDGVVGNSSSGLTEVPTFKKGTINIGDKRVSDFKLYKKIKPKLKSFKRKDLIKKLNFKIAKDASLNLTTFNKIKKNYE